MKPSKAQLPRVLTPVTVLCALAIWLAEGDSLMGQTNPPSPVFHIYAGNLHSHTVYTWSHGPQFNQAIPEDGGKKVPGISVSPDGVQSPAKSQTLKPDWQKLQGPPSEHFARAKTNGYDFYAVTDHSQEAPFAPTSFTNAAWLATKREAAGATDRNFTALAGYEYSENNGPGGVGHINVFNNHTSRTFLLATNRTKSALLDAMKNRRTYASLEQNIQCRYTVNGAMMGSTLKRPSEFAFNITINDPDTDNPKDKIVKLDIVKDGGVVAQTCTPTPACSIQWSPTLHDATNKYFFVRVWNAGGGDAPGADPAKPVAWLAPVWTGR